MLDQKKVYQVWYQSWISYGNTHQLQLCRICSFCSPGPYFFNQTHYRAALIQVRTLVIFKVKLYAKILLSSAIMWGSIF